MEFSVGDRVVHPQHGLGAVTALERLDLVEGFKRYYVIEIAREGLTVRVPVRKAEELGVRLVMSRSILSGVLDTLRGRPRQLSENYRERQVQIQEKLQRGRPLQIAETLCDLTWHGRRAHLTQADSALLARGRELLSAEMALVTNTGIAVAKQLIDAGLMGH